MLEAVLGSLSPAGPRARLTTLIFHRVLAAPDPLFPGEVDAERFDTLCGWLRRWFNVLPLAEAAARLQSGTLPARALSITFDDGYADNHGVALPILRRHGLNATFFVATGFLDGGCMWNDRIIEALRRSRLGTLSLTDPELGDVEFELGSWSRRRQAIDHLLGQLKYLTLTQRRRCADRIVSAAQVELPADLMMRSADVAGLAQAGMLIGGHTADHPILARLTDAEALHQIVAGKQALEAITQQPVTLFAYPNGRPDTDYSARDVALVRRAGFRAAVTTAWGAARADADPLQLPRFTPWDRTRLRFGLRLAKNLFDPGQRCNDQVTGAATPLAPGAVLGDRH